MVQQLELFNVLQGLGAQASSPPKNIGLLELASKTGRSPFGFAMTGV